MFPILYEINARGWLRELSDKAGQRITLGNVPEEQFEHWQRFGFTHIWLMGAWRTGPRARAQALAHASLLASYSEALPDWGEADVAGSPYAVADYHISDSLGGDEELTAFRAKLHERGMKLILDFVPNHLGVDHSWLSLQPELFVQSPTAAPEAFAQQTGAGMFWLAHGKDPYFAAWTDTVQLDYRHEATQRAVIQLLQGLAEFCDGLRCDMAMLLLNDVFVKTWQRFPVSTAATPGEFWERAIPAIKAKHPDFLFLAEAYWGLESKLLSLGFDYTYDKTLYDKLVHRDAAGVQRHLFDSGSQFISRSAHFLENHDEPRIASLLTAPEQRAAALLIMALPGMRFLHQGQLTGARRRVPVQLSRYFNEPAVSEVTSFYEKLLSLLPRTAVGRGDAAILGPSAAWPGNPTGQNITVIQWQESQNQFELVVVNLAPHRSQCYVRLTVADLAKRTWSMKDLLGHEQYERKGKELKNPGLYLDLEAHAAQLFHFEPL